MLYFEYKCIFVDIFVFPSGSCLLICSRVSPSFSCWSEPVRNEDAGTCGCHRDHKPPLPWNLGDCAGLPKWYDISHWCTSCHWQVHKHTSLSTGLTLAWINVVVVVVIHSCNNINGIVSRSVSFAQREPTGLQDWTFSTVRCWGERAEGYYTLRISDYSETLLTFECSRCWCLVWVLSLLLQKSHHLRSVRL